MNFISAEDYIDIDENKNKEKLKILCGIQVISDQIRK